MPTLAGDLITIDARAGSIWSTWSNYHTYYPGLELNSWIDGYRSGVLRVLRAIRATRTGSALTAAIRRPITIAPMPDPSDKDATGGPVGEDYMDAVEYGTRIPVRTGRVFLHYYGRGLGGRAVVHFTPDMWIPSAPIYFRRWWQMDPRTAGHTPDEILFHELVHAVRATHGRFATPQKMGDNFDNRDEFCAILLTNIYSSELRRPLRRDHHGDNPLPMSDQGRGNYLSKYFLEVERCFNDHPELSNEIARVNCAFNPLRDYKEHGPGVVLGIGEASVQRK